MTGITDKKEVAYAGDSDVDMMTGKNAGVMTVGVTWGFRSREELAVARAMRDLGLRFKYETALPVGMYDRYPDFAVLNVRLRKTMYHEHFGMMDDDEYRQNAMLKIREYNKNGYPIGDCLLCTFEGENIPFDQDELNELIRVFLL